jgi:hypothetical protein
VLVLATGNTREGWVTAPDSAPVQVQGERLRVLKRHPVRVVPSEALQQFVRRQTRAKFEAIYGPVPQDFGRQLLAMLGIVDAVRENNPQQVAKMAERAAPRGKLAASWATVQAVMLPWDRVAATVNTGLFGTMLVLWQQSASQAVPALLCRTASQALFALAVFRLSGKHGARICRRCGNPFFASRDKQRYCNYRCRIAAGMERYRKGPKYLKRRRHRGRANR